MSDTSIVPAPEQSSLELKRYQEELADKYGLPSPFKTGLLKQLAQDLTASGMVPRCFQGKPLAVYLAMMRGSELGLDPVTSVMDAFWLSPNGNLGLYSNIKLQIMHERGIRTKFVKEEGDGCEILFTPPESSGHEPYLAKFYFTEAVAAGLNRDDSNWRKWAVDMNVARAVGRGWKRLAGVVGPGANIPSPEEIEEFETVIPPTNGAPEVQAPVVEEKPATAGRKPKEKPVEATPTAPVWVQKYYVISPRDFVVAEVMSQAEIEGQKLAQVITENSADALRACDAMTRNYQASNGENPAYAVLTFDQSGKQSLIHRSVVHSYKFYVVPQKSLDPSMTMEEVKKIAVGNPHTDAKTAGLIAQAQANEKNAVFLVVYEANGQVQLSEKCVPPPAKAATKTTAASPARSPEEQAKRERLQAKTAALTSSLWPRFNDPQGHPVETNRQKVMNSYLQEYCSIANIKEFSKDLDRAERALNALEKDTLSNMDKLLQDPVATAKAAKLRDAAPAPANRELQEMQKYYHERGWNGSTTSQAEHWRRKLNLTPEGFDKTMEFSGVKACGDKDALAYFSVDNTYGSEVGGRFGAELPTDLYAEALRRIRDRFDGAELAAISVDQFKEALEAIIAADPAEPTLFE